MIVVKTNMEKLPTCCAECEILGGSYSMMGVAPSYSLCSITKKRVEHKVYCDERPVWCPLVEIGAKTEEESI